MRTNIDIDDPLLEAAMRAGPFKTKKDAVEAGLKLLARQAAYREVLKWEGKLHWEDNDEALPPGLPPKEPIGAVRPGWSVQEPVAPRYAAKPVGRKPAATKPAVKKAAHGRR